LFDVIKLRVDAWLNPWLDPSGRSYQIVQSILAVANGGLFGRGPGLGSPGTVPVAQSDFIFAAISEEFGLAGGIALVGILAFFTIRGLDIALHAPNRFQRFLAAGVTTYIITQALLIIGGTIRLLPLTGVTLPFMSYGGSSLVTAYFSGFLLLIISNQAEDQPAALENGKSYVFIGTIYLVGFLFVGLAIGWWSMIRADALLSRTDNMRRSISDVYVMRGDILDRNNTVIARSSGTAGDYQRELLYPALSATVGYSNSNYGQTGIEASMDGYLRGVAGNDTSSIWLARELYGQYPQGLNIRLSIDLALQEKADALLQGKTGGLVVMNAESGEVLAIANSPTFDANQLDDKWQTWIADTSAPLLNRVTLGQYPVGTATGAFLLASYLQDHDLPSYDPSTNWTTSTGQNNSCAVDPGENPSWQKLIQSGCPFALQSLFQQSTPLDLMSFYESIGITGKATTQMESVDSWTYSAVDSLPEFFTSDNIRVSPLQMVIAAAEITNGGQRVSPSFVTAYQTPQGDWRYISTQTSNDEIDAFSSPEATNLLTQPDSPNWQVVSSVNDQDKWVSWFVGGTPANWQGVPLAVVVVLEDSSPTQTAEIGQTLFNDLFSQ
ncbi:MAG: FtsW/RodA/SpoVE family cell cycle protein, partial [Anaerolineaceae bacterium]|nr:FtsW/RodA/SpoVE family cell cycle protein [Anaerolineaceae bacterium]